MAPTPLKKATPSPLPTAREHGLAIRSLVPIARHSARPSALGRLVIPLGLATGLTLAAGGIALEYLTACAPGDDAQVAPIRMHSTHVSSVAQLPEHRGRPVDPLAQAPPARAAGGTAAGGAESPNPASNAADRPAPAYIAPERNVPRMAGDVAGPMQE